MVRAEDELILEIIEVLGSNLKAQSWLAKPNQALGGRIPLDIISSPGGRKEIRQILGRIDHGIIS